MSAQRVPPGWTQAAADLVWEDWRDARSGVASRHIGSVAFDSHVSDAEAELLACVPGLTVAPWLVDSPLRYAWWSTTEARLRAWAAVGAPVLAPAEDGRPSLAEWVAACEGSALGRPCSIDQCEDGIRMYWPNGEIVLFELVDGSLEAVCITSEALYCDTPAALRSALDALVVHP